MTVWNEEMIRFLADASEYVGFNDALARHIAKFLSENAHVCDAGCGLGYLSLALLPYAAHVTAIDCAEDALAVLRENSRCQDVARLEIVCGDAFHLPQSAQFDAMVFCFFGGIEETLRAAKAHCQGPVILIKKGWETRRFSTRTVPTRKITASAAMETLSRLQVPFVSESFPLDMGQPFRSPSDALAFFQLYAKSDDSAETVTLDDILPRLVRTDSPEFPYYLPANREIGLLVVQADDIPDALFPM